MTKKESCCKFLTLGIKFRVALNQRRCSFRCDFINGVQVLSLLVVRRNREVQVCVFLWCSSARYRKNFNASSELVMKEFLHLSGNSTACSGERVGRAPRLISCVPPSPRRCELKARRIDVRCLCGRCINAVPFIHLPDGFCVSL